MFGGTLPAALAADWLATAWDQNAGLYALARGGRGGGGHRPLAADLLGLPPGVTFGFVTGARMANFTASRGGSA